MKSKDKLRLVLTVMRLCLKERHKAECMAIELGAKREDRKEYYEDMLQRISQFSRFESATRLPNSLEMMDLFAYIAPEVGIFGNDYFGAFALLFKNPIGREP